MKYNAQRNRTPQNQLADMSMRNNSPYHQIAVMPNRWERRVTAKLAKQSKGTQND
jgi:hypothetical protein